MQKFKIPNVENEKTVLKTIRIRRNILERVEKLASKHNVSPNRLINESIIFALDNLEEEESKEKV